MDLIFALYANASAISADLSEFGVGSGCAGALASFVSSLSLLSSFCSSGV